MSLSRPSNDQARLSMIREDSDALPPLPTPPPRTSHRPFSKRWRDSPPLHSSDKPPPLYSVWDITGPRGEKLLDVRNNKFLSRRGGWKRLCIALLLLAAVAIGLGVGLGLGLPARSRKSSSGNTSPASNQTGQPFPLGSFSIVTYLDVVTTECTANPSTWSCFPGTTYNSSSTASLVTFDWIINGTTGDLLISSTPNPFAITFSNVSLSLVDPGSLDERYSFSVSLDKYVIPSEPILPNNEIAGCYYNGTTLEGSLYTKKTAAGGNGTTSPNGGGQGQNFVNWPYAAEVNQSIAGGSNVPACYPGDGVVQGSRITSGLAPQPTTSDCGCNWRNYDL